MVAYLLACCMRISSSMKTGIDLHVIEKVPLEQGCQQSSWAAVGCEVHLLTQFPIGDDRVSCRGSLGLGGAFLAGGYVWGRAMRQIAGRQLRSADVIAHESTRIGTQEGRKRTFGQGRELGFPLPACLQSSSSTGTNGCQVYSSKPWGSVSRRSGTNRRESFSLRRRGVLQSCLVLWSCRRSSSNTWTNEIQVNPHAPRPRPRRARSHVE